MRILMVTDFYWPFLGGVEQHVRNLSTELVARGHEVTVATLWQQGLSEIEWDHGVCIRRLRSTTQRFSRLFKHPRRPWAPPFADPEVTRALWSVVRDFQPQIVHGHDWLAHSFLPLKRASDAKFALSQHYYTVTCAKKSLMYNESPCEGPDLRTCLACASAHYGAPKGIPVALSVGLTRNVLMRMVDIFLPVSHFTAKGNGLISDDLPVQIIPNFISENQKSHDDVNDYVEQLPAVPYFMFVGDFRRHKGLEVLLAAYQKLRDRAAGAGVEVPPLVLIGKVWDETPANFPPGVVVLHDWPNYAVMAAWRRCLTAVVPSIWPEPFGIVTIEAMTAGRPVIATNIGGIAEIVVHEETGLLVPPSDVDALSIAMWTLLLDNKKRSRFGEAGKERSLLYQSKTVIPLIETVYKQLLYVNNASFGK